MQASAVSLQLDCMAHPSRQAPMGASGGLNLRARLLKTRVSRTTGLVSSVGFVPHLRVREEAECDTCDLHSGHLFGYLSTHAAIATASFMYHRALHADVLEASRCIARSGCIRCMHAGFDKEAHRMQQQVFSVLHGPRD